MRNRRAIPRDLRRRVRDRAENRCEYCGHPAAFSSAPFVCEHVLPYTRGSGDSFGELAWACPACNSHKYDKVRAVDPKTGRLVALFNPRRQQWRRHFRWNDDSLLIHGRTATGRATVACLKLNRLELINLRRALMAIEAHPPH